MIGEANDTGEVGRGRIAQRTVGVDRSHARRGLGDNRRCVQLTIQRCRTVRIGIVGCHVDAHAGTHRGLGIVVVGNRFIIAQRVMVSG